MAKAKLAIKKIYARQFGDNVQNLSVNYQVVNFGGRAVDRGGKGFVATVSAHVKADAVQEGWFDFSGKEMKNYIAFAQQKMNWYPDNRLRTELKRKFPEIKPVDIERTIKHIQTLRQNRAP